MLLVPMTVFVSWKLTLASLVPLPFTAFPVRLYGGWIPSRFMAAQTAFDDGNEGGWKPFRAFGHTARAAGKVDSCPLVPGRGETKDRSS